MWDSDCEAGFLSFWGLDVLSETQLVFNCLHDLSNISQLKCAKSDSLVFSCSVSHMTQ